MPRKQLPAAALSASAARSPPTPISRRCADAAMFECAAHAERPRLFAARFTDFLPYAHALLMLCRRLAAPRTLPACRLRCAFLTPLPRQSMSHIDVFHIIERLLTYAVIRYCEPPFCPLTIRLCRDFSRQPAVADSMPARSAAPAHARRRYARRRAHYVATLICVAPAAVREESNGKTHVRHAQKIMARFARERQDLPAARGERDVAAKAGGGRAADTVSAA